MAKVMEAEPTARVPCSREQLRVWVIHTHSVPGRAASVSDLQIKSQLYVSRRLKMSLHKKILSSLYQEPGRAERAFARYDATTFLKKFYSIESDDFTAPPGVDIIDFLQAPSLPPSWITEEELRKCAEKFQNAGFTGPLNYYRMFDT
ncbi:hypothetical protein EJB05_13587, partial [Eragrostis curvula]